ncbi:Npun_F5749 family FMN-dependent PPOX-type flavoprotein [Calothrix sp. 336/3]|uniref:Npun_F5749 family FMN-dependent PPOX-type flavoprotein n=1 Tax=Calothrix sp. 336/3 TaxID=1337936 RepID=UPI0004E3C6B5|nr:Npun_F5749 family FMN-dependent PPOX-type flavoprotein [Calothrix sp. 336/3]AKG22506.1 pyridoxamine 5'-phosphate oxidase [Calothrix sp. 336/3]
MSCINSNWRSPLARALHRNRSLVYSRYVQLATVTSENRPANRTVVFRGFLENSNHLKFITDIRSQKIEQIIQQPWAEICWYFPNSREQFRLSGQLILVTEETTDTLFQQSRHSTWQSLSDAARSQFAWSHPGKIRDTNPDAFNPPLPNPTQTLSNFCLLLLDPIKVDHLELRGEPQNRYLYEYDHALGWLMKSVNP